MAYHGTISYTNCGPRTQLVHVMCCLPYRSGWGREGWQELLTLVLLWPLLAGNGEWNKQLRCTTMLFRPRMKWVDTSTASCPNKKKRSNTQKKKKNNKREMTNNCTYSFLRRQTDTRLRGEAINDYECVCVVLCTLSQFFKSLRSLYICYTIYIISFALLLCRLFFCFLLLLLTFHSLFI